MLLRQPRPLLRSLLPYRQADMGSRLFKTSGVSVIQEWIPDPPPPRPRSGSRVPIPIKPAPKKEPEVPFVPGPGSPTSYPIFIFPWERGGGIKPPPR